MSPGSYLPPPHVVLPNSQLPKIPRNHNNKTSNNLDCNLEDPNHRLERKRQHADNRPCYHRQLLLVFVLSLGLVRLFTFLDLDLRFILTVPLRQFNILVETRTLAPARPRTTPHRGCEFLQTFTGQGRGAGFGGFAAKPMEALDKGVFEGFGRVFLLVGQGETGGWRLKVLLAFVLGFAAARGFCDGDGEEGGRDDIDEEGVAKAGEGCYVEDQCVVGEVESGEHCVVGRGIGGGG